MRARAFLGCETTWNEKKQYNIKMQKATDELDVARNWLRITRDEMNDARIMMRDASRAWRASRAQ